MNHNNPIHEAIYKSVVKPAMSSRKMSVEGVAYLVNYEKNTATVIWKDPDSGSERHSHRVPLPVDGDGLFKQTVEDGDGVTLSFKNGNLNSPYISAVHSKIRGINHNSKNGAGIPKEIANGAKSGNWKNLMMEMKYQHGMIDHSSEDAKDYVIKPYEIALKHPDTGAVVKLTDDGLIDVFAGPQVGVRIDPHNKSVNLFGDSVNVVANHFNVRTRNSAVINPKVKYSEGMVSLMKDLGLPAETVDKEDN